MDFGTSPERGFDRMEEMRRMLERDVNRNCLNMPDFIDDVLLQKDLYGSYSSINADPAYKPTYTFTEPNSPSSESNSIFLDKNDKQQNLVTGEHDMGSEAYSSYREDRGTISLALDPTFDSALDGCDYEEAPPIQGWEEDLIDSMWPEFSGAENDIFHKATLGPCMDVDSEGVEFTVVDAPELTIDVSDYKIDTCILVGQENANVDLEKPKISHIDNKIITEVVDHGVNEKSGSVDLDLSDLPQLSMDPIPMESILEGSDYEEVALIQVDCKTINSDLLSQILSGIDNSTVIEPIDGDIDLINGGIDMEVSNVLHVNKNAIPTERTTEILGQLTSQVNQGANLLEKTLDHNSVPVCTSPGRPSFEGKSRSQSPYNAIDKNRRSLSQSRSQTNSSTSRRRSKSPMQSRSPVKSRDHYRRSRSVNNSRDGRRRSQSRSRSGIYSRDRYRRSNSRSWVNSRDSERRSQSQSKFGSYSRDCDRRTWSRSRSPPNSRDVRRRSHSRSPINSRGIHKSQSGSHISLRDLPRLSPRQKHVKQRNWPTQRSPQLLKRQQCLHCRSSRWSPTHQKQHSSRPPVR